MTFIQGKSKKAGFSLMELLVVISIIALLSALGGPALSALAASGGTNQNIAQLSGILEQAREYAVSQNTYVWVTFYTSTTSVGIKQVSVAVVASTDGTDPAANGATPTAWQQFNYGVAPSSNLAMISRIVTLKQVSLQVANSLTPTALPASPVVADPSNSLAANGTTGYFSIQVPGASTPTVFTQAIEFTPSGQARNSSSPINVIDLDVLPQKGTVDDTKNVAVLRVNGLTGETAVYRQ